MGRGKTGNKYYAVARGNKVGVYTSWAACQEQVNGYSRAVFKSFPTEAAAQAFVAAKRTDGNLMAGSVNQDEGGRSNGSSSHRYPGGPAQSYAPRQSRSPLHRSSSPNLRARSRSRSPRRSQPAPTRSPRSSRTDLPILEIGSAFIDLRPVSPPRANYIDLRGTPDLAFSQPTDEAPRSHAWHFTAQDFDLNPRDGRRGAIQIFTDGSSRANGTVRARAGYGIYHHDSSPANFAGRLLGPRQTNQRAELTAILEAVRQVPQELSVQVNTDSMYSIKCLTIWHQSWARNHWKNKEGKAVENQDLIRACLQLFQSREGHVELKKCAAHTGVYGNEMADRLANEGAMMD